MKSKVFNTEMIQAILKGDKTQFREPIKLDLGQLETDINDKDYLYLEDEYGDSHHLKEYSPYQVGNTIFVKETWAMCHGLDKFPTRKLNNEWRKQQIKEHLLWYKADNKEYVVSETVGDHQLDKGKWRSAISIPQEFARIFLKIKDIKAQRVQDINSWDATYEGTYDILIKGHPLFEKAYARGTYDKKDGNIYAGSIEAFAALWDSKYEKKGYGWNENPWVWCVEFERVEKPVHEGNRKK